MTAQRTQPYQRRRPGPAIVVVSVLAVLAIAIWTTVLVSGSGSAARTSCPAPAAGPAPGTALPPGGLAGVAPVPASTVRVRVLNAGGQRNQANLVAAELGDLGFGQAAPPTNDPFFPAGGMDCTGQLRFGPAGEAAASTLSLVVPCAQLVRDGRTDATVDVAVGRVFGDLNPIRAARDALAQLAVPTTPGADPAGDDTSTAAPTVDPATLAKARSITC